MVGIPPAAPHELASIHHSLPTILYIRHQNPIPSYSKAPWGLSVLLQVTGIFTGNTISPGLPPRQRSDHYTFRAGRNLPDKEFRYLRTVIVTAAVHWGFNSALARLLLTFQHWQVSAPILHLSILQRPVFLLNSCLGLFTAALFPEHPFSRSYGVNLPSSLTTLLPLALESSSCLPVSVCGTGILDIHKAFLAFVHACFPT